MAGVNKVILVGNLGSDPEIRRTQSGDAVAQFSIATSESWKDKNTGEKQERTEWHRIVLWRKLAEIAEKYLHKGSKIYLEGKLQTRKWQDQNGQDRYTTEVIGDSFQMLDGKPSGDGQQQQRGNDDRARNHASQQMQAPAGSGGPAGFDDDIPFNTHMRGLEYLA